METEEDLEQQVSKADNSKSQLKIWIERVQRTGEQARYWETK